MATHSSILAWRIPWTEEPGGLHTVHGVTKSQTRLSDRAVVLTELFLNPGRCLGRVGVVSTETHKPSQQRGHPTLPPFPYLTWRITLRGVVSFQSPGLGGRLWCPHFIEETCSRGHRATFAKVTKWQTQQD